MTASLVPILTKNKGGGSKFRSVDFLDLSQGFQRSAALAQNSRVASCGAGDEPDDAATQSVI